MKDSIQFSKVIAGTMKWGQWGARFSTSAYLQIIEDCLAMGVTTFDHADIYGNYTTEEDFGKALNEKPSFRKEMQLITKCGIRMVTPNRPSHQIKSYDTSYAHITDSVNRSLKNLATDYIDLLLIHRPDPLMNPEEISEAFAHLRQQGKVLHFGVSNFSPSQLALIKNHTPIIANQVEISLMKTSPFFDGTIDQCLNEEIVPMSWSPLGGGTLMTNGTDERSRKILAVAEILGEKYQATPDQILLAWLFKHPAGILPVLGTTKSERIGQALNASKISLSREEWFMLLRASHGEEVP